MEPSVALDLSCQLSDTYYTVTLDGLHLCTWGWRDEEDGRAAVWMLSFEGVEEHTVMFARHSRRLMEDLLKVFASLECLVWSGHTLSLRWLTWLGFTIHEAQAVGPEVFYTMRKERG